METEKHKWLLAEIAGGWLESSSQGHRMSLSPGNYSREPPEKHLGLIDFCARRMAEMAEARCGRPNHSLQRSFLQKVISKWIDMDNYGHIRRDETPKPRQESSDGGD